MVLRIGYRREAVDITSVVIGRGNAGQDDGFMSSVGGSSVAAGGMMQIYKLRW